MSIDDIGSSTPSGLKLNNYAKEFLKETAKWASFLSIIGFIGIGLMVIMALFFGTVFSSLSGFEDAGIGAELGGGFIMVTYLVMAVLYFFPVYYLYKFSVNMKKALYTNDDDVLATAFEKLKSHYKFLGILTIVILSLYILGFIIGFLGAATSSF